LENIPRVLPEGVRAVIDASSWQRPAIFDWLQEQGNVEDMEMYRTFNNGIGMVVVVSADESEKALSLLQQAGEQASIIGRIETAADNDDSVVINK
jgi:phosphoribosylformylglycinamidine cyclo-ligase